MRLFLGFVICREGWMQKGHSVKTSDIQGYVMTNATRILSGIHVFAVLALLAGCQSVPTPTWDLPVGIKTLPANGYPMSYLERGDGPTVVLVHGALSDYRYWTPQISSLSSHFRLIAVSLRHYYPERWNGN